MASAADAAEVAALLDRFNAEFGDPSPGAGALEPRVAEHIERDLSLFLLAGPADVGVAQLRFREALFEEGSICYLEELYVVPDRRGEGHGRTLLETAIDLARAHGAKGIEVVTSRTDAAARELYGRLGFSNLERANDPGSEMLLYERAL